MTPGVPCSKTTGFFPTPAKTLLFSQPSRLKILIIEYVISTLKIWISIFRPLQINDLKKFSSYYLKQENSKSGLLTGMRAQTPADAASKITTLTTASLKCTEKQAKTKLSSIYDFAIHIENLKIRIELLQ